jgi:arabinose-5-phosphate isomerase
MIEIARKVLTVEAEAISALIDRIDGEFTKAVDMILVCKGRVVITGMGKSGLICQKIARPWLRPAPRLLSCIPPKGFTATWVC